MKTVSDLIEKYAVRCGSPLLVSLLVFFFAGVCPVPHADAARYAVLVGLSSYQSPNLTLDAPKYDISSLKSMLVSKFGFSESNVLVVQDKEATRDNILDILNRIERESTDGDFIFIYYSGHGTSSHELASLGDATGALVPYDFDMRESFEKYMSKLIVGKKDLRPIFSRLDKGRKTLIVFDACFSGNTVRDVFKQRGTPRFVPIGRSGSSRDVSSPAPVLDVKKSEPYPYHNIVYISAADETEKALEFATSEYDGKPHGALTDALLVGLNGFADTNSDNKLTYEEFYHFSKRMVSAKAAQTPQLLYDRSAQTQLSEAVFNNTGVSTLDVSQTGTWVTRFPDTMTVKLEGTGAESLASRINAIPGVKVITDGNYDLLVSREEGRCCLALACGDKLCTLGDTAEVTKRVAGYARVRELLNLKKDRQKFNIWMSPGSYEGQTVDFTIKSEADAHLLLLNIDSLGCISIIYPESATSDTLIKKGVVLKKTMGQVTGPTFGVEFLKLFAFKKKLKGLERLGGESGTLDAAGEDSKKLLELIKKEGGDDWAETALQVVTKNTKEQ